MHKLFSYILHYFHWMFRVFYVLIFFFSSPYVGQRIVFFIGKYIAVNRGSYCVIVCLHFNKGASFHTPIISPVLVKINKEAMTNYSALQIV